MESGRSKRRNLQYIQYIDRGDAWAPGFDTPEYTGYSTPTLSQKDSFEKNALA